MRLVVLGIGNAFSARFYSSCLAVVSGEDWLLFDCPHPIRKILKEASDAAGVPLPLERLKGVFLSHLHADHVSGLEGLAYYFWFVLGRKLPLLTVPEIAGPLWTSTLAGGMEWSRSSAETPPVRRTFDDFFEPIFLKERVPVSIGRFRVECRHTIHNIPTIAARISVEGRTLGCSADTAFDPGLIDWLADADLIVHEAGGSFLHTSIDELLTVAEPVREKIRVLHCRDDFDFANSPIPPLRQGEMLEV